MSFKVWMINEESVSSFLLNPNNKDKTWYDLLNDFMNNGGDFLGAGSFGQVLSHKNWNYALKIYEDEFYTRFVRFANQNPSTAFPKFYGNPRKIKPIYKDAKPVYIVMMEKLLPLDDKTTSIIIKNATRMMQYYYFPHAKWEEEKKIEQDYPKLIPVFKALLKIHTTLLGALDVNENNFMRRPNGDVVIIDPLFEGTEPGALTGRNNKSYYA